MRDHRYLPRRFCRSHRSRETRRYVVIMNIGEARDMTGESHRAAAISIFPAFREDLVRAIVETGKPVVVLISAGRPLVFNYHRRACFRHPLTPGGWGRRPVLCHMPTSFLATTTRSAKLPISFPRTEGQIPVYYSHFMTGRPARNDSDGQLCFSLYRSAQRSPLSLWFWAQLYSFRVQRPSALAILLSNPGGILTATITLTNARKVSMVARRYNGISRDMVGKCGSPCKRIKGIPNKSSSRPGESGKLSFTIDVDKLRFYNDKLEHIFEPGEFRLFVGGDSQNVREIPFTLTAGR